MTKEPFFKELTNDELRSAYWARRALAYNNAAIAQSGRSSARKMAPQMGQLMRSIDIIEGIARQRKISLAQQ